MPLLAGAWAPPSTTPEPPEAQPLRITYTDPDGAVWDWSNPETGCVITSVAGLGSPPALVTSTSLPGGGVLPTDYMSGQRQVIIGLDVHRDDQADFLALLDRLHRALWTERYGRPAPGTLTVARPDGTARTLSVLCTSGPEQTDAEAARSGYTDATDFALTFVTTTDPLFNDRATTRLVFQTGVEGTGVPPLPPVRLRPLRGLDEGTIINPGNGDAFPLWRITGPGQPTLTNRTTGRAFGLSTTLAAGEVVTIDTQPAQQQATDASGQDRWGDLVKSSPRDLWTLPPGESKVSILMSSSGPTSQIELTFRTRWLRA
ncbi:phage tail domain-containing protein [Actinomadura litoris]|uniref:phage tail domain-containing protein n=1 Tax=Actinomadura litoris TaxID=2678616 RepID=UPI001FA74000|nr:phage tail domain-containing protein [Actinomadura litoris]